MAPSSVGGVSGLRVGLGDQLFYTGLGSMAMTRANFFAAAATGVDSFWVPDHLNSLLPRSIMTPKYIGSTAAKLMPRADAVNEPWTALGYLAAKNRFARLRLGTSVTDAGRRNPAVTAQAAATLHLMTRGRAILGMGTGEREGNEPYGVDWSKPVGRLVEALATIRALWDSPGELVTRDSPFFPLHNAIFDLPPTGAPPVLLPANGLVIRLAGPQVVVLDKDNVAHFRSIVLGRDLGTATEVVSGLNPGDLIVLSPGDAVTDGAKVEPQIQK